jgi:hypothetical protein
MDHGKAREWIKGRQRLKGGGQLFFLTTAINVTIDEPFELILG